MVMKRWSISLASSCVLVSGVLWWRWNGDGVHNMAFNVLYIIVVCLLGAPSVGIPATWLLWKLLLKIADHKTKPPTGRTIVWNDTEWVIKSTKYAQGIAAMHQNEAQRPLEGKDGRTHRVNNSDPKYKEDSATISRVRPSGEDFGAPRLDNRRCSRVGFRFSGRP